MTRAESSGAADRFPVATVATVAVVGAGVIGTSVAYACLQAGHRVVMVDRADKDWSGVRSSLRRQQRLSRLTGPDRHPADLGRLTLSHDLADVAGADLVIENITEDWQTKKALFNALRELGGLNGYIAANTSAIPIGRLAAEAPDAQRVVGLHFMNPASAIDMVEVVRGPATSDDTMTAVLDFLTGLGKRAVVVNDSPGFVINRILMVMVNQAAELVEEGVAPAHDIDQLFTGCLGHRMGPLRTGDLIGIDTVVNTLITLRDALGPMFEPAPRLRAMVARGELGIKTGKGFYDYSLELAGE